MALNLPNQTSVNRSEPIEPFTVKDPAIIDPEPGEVVPEVLYGPQPGDPSPFVRKSQR
jgi:hypothetical protein